MADEDAARQPDQGGDHRIDGHAFKKLHFGSRKTAGTRNFQGSRKLKGIRSGHAVDIRGVERAMVCKMHVAVGGANRGTPGQTVLRVAIGPGAGDRGQPPPLTVGHIALAAKVEGEPRAFLKGKAGLRARGEGSVIVIIGRGIVGRRRIECYGLRQARRSERLRCYGGIFPQREQGVGGEFLGHAEQERLVVVGAVRGYGIVRN